MLPALICRDCGQMPTCATCGVPFRLFQRPSRLICAYCEKHSENSGNMSILHGDRLSIFWRGYAAIGGRTCSSCSRHISVFRFDRDQVKSVEESARLFFSRFRQGEICSCSSGLEVLLHQSDPPSAQLIAFPQADLGLHLPDFRSAERAFFLLSKAARVSESSN